MANAKKQPKKTSNTIISRQKTLLPTLKEQQRYLVYKVLSGDDQVFNLNINFEKIHNDILAQSNLLLGIFDGAKAGLMSAKYNPDKQTGIIRVNNKYVDKFKVCLGMIKVSNNKKIIVDCIYVSGVINKAIDKMNN